MPEMRECQEHDSAFRFCITLKWQQTFGQLFSLGILRRRMWLHSPHLRLPLTLRHLVLYKPSLFRKSLLFCRRAALRSEPGEELGLGEGLVPSLVTNARIF